MNPNFLWVLSVGTGHEVVNFPYLGNFGSLPSL